MRVVTSLSALLLLAISTATLSAQNKPQRAAGEKPAEKPAIKKFDKAPTHAAKPDKGFVDKSAGGMNRAREAAALAFVHEHHAELESLLASLKERQPKQYEAAIRDLHRHSERLAVAQEKDSARYELELKAWKAQSRVQLLSATVLMSPQDVAAKAKLKQTLLEQLRLRREVLVLEREQHAKRLQKIDEQLDKFDREMDAMADRELQAILSGVRAKGKDFQKTATPTGKRAGAQ